MSETLTKYGIDSAKITTKQLADLVVDEFGVSVSEEELVSCSASNFHS